MYHHISRDLYIVVITNLLHLRNQFLRKYLNHFHYFQKNILDHLDFADIFLLCLLD